MKKTLLSLILIGIALFNVNGQCTPDNSLNSTGVYFDKTNIPCINETYEQTIHMAITNDTTIPPFSVSLDSIQITSVTGIPAGLDYQCTSPNCTVVASSGTHTQTCLLISGTPTQTGDFTIQFTARLYALGSSITQTFDVPGSVINCINGLEKFKENTSIDIFPQPSKDNSTLRITLPSASNSSISLYDMTGSKLFNIYEGPLNSGINTIRLNEFTSALKEGVYLINTQIGEDNISKKLIIE